MSVWVKVDVNVTEHPKCVALSPDAWTLWLHGLTYAGRNLSDGHIPTVMLSRLSGVPRPQKAADELVDAGLWDEIDEGWLIHDYLDHQRSAEEAAEQSTKAKRGANKTNHQRWHVGKGRHDPNCRYCVADSDRPSDKDSESPSESLSGSQSSRRSDLVTSPPHTYGDLATDSDDELTSNLAATSAGATLGRRDHDKARADGVAIIDQAKYRKECIARRQTEAAHVARAHPDWTAEQIVAHLSKPAEARTTPASESTVLALADRDRETPDVEQDPERRKQIAANARAEIAASRRSSTSQGAPNP